MDKSRKLAKLLKKIYYINEDSSDTDSNGTEIEISESKDEDELSDCCDINESDSKYEWIRGDGLVCRYSLYDKLCVEYATAG